MSARNYYFPRSSNIIASNIMLIKNRFVASLVCTVYTSNVHIGIYTYRRSLHQTGGGIGYSILLEIFTKIFWFKMWSFVVAYHVFIFGRLELISVTSLVYDKINLKVQLDCLSLRY